MFEHPLQEHTVAVTYAGAVTTEQPDVSVFEPLPLKSPKRVQKTRMATREKLCVC